MNQTVHVVEGDTLWSLAEKYLGDGKRWPELWKLNQDAIINEQLKHVHSALSGPDLLFPGMKIDAPLEAHDDEK
jgi:nucleoid-associated protein YgaU